MLMIRLQRVGRKNVPQFRLVLAEKSAAVKGLAKEFLGHYNAATGTLSFKEGRIGHWVKHGARLSDTAARLLTRAGVKGMGTFIVPYTKKRPKTAEAAPVAPPAVATPTTKEQGEQEKEGS